MTAPEITITHATVTDAQHRLLSALHEDAGKRSLIEVGREVGFEGNGPSARLKSAIQRVGVVPLIKQYPGASDAILRADAKLKGKSLPGILERDDPPTIKHQDLLQAVQDKLCLALSYIDKHNVSQAKLSELTSTIKALFDVGQVLQGKPTSISASDNIRALKDLVPALMREAERRGIVTVEGEVVEVREPKQRRKSRRKDTAAAELQDYSARLEAAQHAGCEVSPALSPPTWADGVGVFDSGPVAEKPQSTFSKLIEDM